jgi:hypothetical protein
MKGHALFKMSPIAAGLFCWLISMLPACAQPCFFEEVSTEVGLHETGPCGVPVWFDWDNDGDLDVILCRRFGNPVYVYQNEDGHFTRLTNIGLPTDADCGSVKVMDFNHDGNLDIFLCCYESSSMLMAKVGDVYADVTTAVGLPYMSGMRWAHWVDFDRDGWMDWLACYGSSYHLYRNQNGHFTDITSQTDLPSAVLAGGTDETDTDLDGDMDLFIAVLDGQDYYFVNQNGTLVDRTNSSHLNLARARIHAVWMDINHDKLPDLLTQGDGKHTIWLNNGDGTFTEMNVHGTATDFSVWAHDGCYAVADFDMDGDYDFYACRPGGCPGGGLAPNQFFICDSMNINTLDIWFHDVAPQWGMDIMEDGVPTAADIDGDGDLDLTISSQDLPTRVYRNLTNNPDRLEIRPLGPNGERDRWMTRVEVYPHGNPHALGATEINSSNVGVNGFNNYFVLDQNGHYDLRVYFACGVVMTADQYPYLSDVVPSQIGHLLTIRQGRQLDTPHEPPTTPGDFALNGTFPNPFNSTTNIRYSVADDGMAQLSVYNLNGQRVADLLNGFVTKGEHMLPWNASELATGVYVLELRSGTRYAHAKAMLLK